MSYFVSLSAVEPGNDTEDSDAWTDTAVTNNKSPSIYGTAPRSKVSLDHNLISVVLPLYIATMVLK